MKVELIYDCDCPNVEATRTQLLRAFSSAGVDAKWSEWDRALPASPEYVRQYGSPTVLVGGNDVAPDGQAVANCCRRYVDQAGALKGAPPVESILAALRQGMHTENSGTASRAPKASWKAIFGTAPSVGVAMLPKLTCAACWPAYAALMSTLGFGFFDYTAYLLPITIIALAATLASLAWRANARRGYGPLALGTVAAVLHLAGKFVLDSNVVAYAAVPVLIGAALWNAWPRKVAASSCGARNFSIKMRQSFL